MGRSITVPLRVVNILDKYHKNPFVKVGCGEILHNDENILEKYDKY
jgi:hypothetical protein